jgi:hypothetical protein
MGARALRSARIMASIAIAMMLASTFVWAASSKSEPTLGTKNQTVRFTFYGQRTSTAG